MDILSTAIVLLAIVLFVYWNLLNRHALRLTAPRGETPAGGRGLAIGLAVWLAATALFAALGAAKGDARLITVALLPAFGGAATLAMREIGRRIALATPLAILIGLMVFRLPLELVLLRLYEQGRLPVQMTFHGLNYDIAIGTSALLLAIWASVSTPPRSLLIAWNTLGFVLLAVVGTVAILSMPTPLRHFTNGPSTILLSSFPYIWIPTFLAASALAGHVLIYRKLMMEACSRRNLTKSIGVLIDSTE